MDEELAERNKLTVDFIWTEDESLVDAESLPEPHVPTQEIADDLQPAIEQFAAIVYDLKA